MTFVSSVGGDQDAEWMRHSKEDAAAIQRARAFVDVQDFPRASSELDSLVQKGNAEALFMAAGFSRIGETETQYERRRFEFLSRAAEGDYPPALYALGAYYDTEGAIEADKQRAAQMFRRAALRGHAHSQWILGLNLLYGTNGIECDVQEGLRQIHAAAEAKFQGALETLSRFYEQGQFGFPVDIDKAEILRKQSTEDDSIGY